MKPLLAILAGLCVLLASCEKPMNKPTPSGPAVTRHPAPVLVTVRDLDPAGTLTPPNPMPKVVKTEAEWRRQLTPEQYAITRDQSTERAFCGRFYDHKKPGLYLCVCCGLPLFTAEAKFDSGTGWPSFFQPVAPENVLIRPDRSHGMVRTEILCARCDAHLGHVFDDGPQPTGQRYCLNSGALVFRPQPTPPER